MELTSADLRAITAMHTDWIARERDGRAASILDLCAEAIVFLPPDATPLVGKDTIAGWLAANQVMIQSLETTDFIVHGAGRLASLSARYATTWIANGGARQTEGEHTWILRKADAWEVIAVAWTS